MGELSNTLHVYLLVFLSNVYRENLLYAIIITTRQFLL